MIRLVELRKPELKCDYASSTQKFFKGSGGVEIAVKLSEQIQFIGVTDDVGGGGISFICDGHIPIGMNAIISCWVLAPLRMVMIEHIPFTARLYALNSYETGKQLAMIRFADIADRETSETIRFCFERQMDFRKRVKVALRA